MKRRILTLILALALLVPLLPAPARAAETDDLRRTITEQYDAYAASIYQPNANNEAVKQLLYHSLDHPGVYLEMDESDPLTAAVFQSDLFREYFIETSLEAVELMCEEQEDRMLIGGAMVKWHDFALEYGAHVYEYTEGEMPDPEQAPHSSAIPNTIYHGSANQYDKSLMLVVGSARGWLRFVRKEVNAERVTYHVEVTLMDNFDFSGKYGPAEAEGFDTSTAMLITLVGRLFLNEYSWSTTVDFDLSVPNPCDHDRQSENYRWEFEGSEFHPVSGEGLTVNPIEKMVSKVYEPETESYADHIYFRVEDMIRLKHDLPWAVEFRMGDSTTSFMMSYSSDGNDTSPFLYRGGEFAACAQYVISPRQENGKRLYGWDMHGIKLTDYGYRSSDMHTYRFENRIAEDGTNVVYLMIDGAEIGPMEDRYYREDVNKRIFTPGGKNPGWYNGVDFELYYFFNQWLSYNEKLTVEYVQIWENGEGAEPFNYYSHRTVEPTCTEPGGVVRDCQFCGASYLEEETAPALGHTLETLPGASATCEVDGLAEGARCTTCGEVVTAQEIIPALGHAWDGGTVTTAPNCTAEGVMTYVCTVDPAHTKTEVIPATGHSSVVDAAVDATCTADGLTEGSHCEICGEILTAQGNIPATGHSWDDGIVAERPSVDAPGNLLYTCRTCGETRTEEIPYDPQVTRLAGENRFETAFVAADEMKETLGVEKFDTIVVASGMDFADALSGSYLAATKNAPILLASSVEWINDLTKDYIKANLVEGGTVYILGGENAVPAAFEEGLDSFTVTRLAGGNRFETNLKILSEAGVGDKPILVCTGLSFADSLSASATELPILLVWNDLTEGQKKLLANLGDSQFYIIGGESAVSAKMEEQLTAYGTVERVAGGNRFETSVAIAEKFFDSPESAVLAYAWNFPDGLCGGPLAATLDAPLILTMENYETQAAAYVQNNAISNGIILGGEGLISDTSANLIFGTTK